MIKKIKLSTLSYEIVEKNQNKKIKAASEITLRAPLKEIPNEYWDKVEVDNDWDREYVESTNTVTKDRDGNTRSGAKEVPMMESNKNSPWDRRFRNQADLDNFRRYIADNEKERIIKTAWIPNVQWGEGQAAIKDFATDVWFFLQNPASELTQLLKNGNKLFASGGHGKLKNKEAFTYLKSIISSFEIKANIKFTPGQEFTLKDWDKWRINVEGEIEVSEQIAQEWQHCNSLQHQQLLVKHEEKETNLQQLSVFLFPNQPYNFDHLKQEIIRLKYEELALQVRKEKSELDKLITNAKNKVGENSASIIDQLLEAQKQSEQTSKASQKDKLSGKIEAYQSILENHLTKQEIQTLLNKQTELYQLEKHLTNLQQNQEQTPQILHNPPKTN